MTKHLVVGGKKSLGTTVLGNMKLAGQTGAAVSALLGGAVVTLSYGHLLWANAILSWIPMLLVLGVTEPPAPLVGIARRSGQKTSRSYCPPPWHRAARRGSCSSI